MNILTTEHLKKQVPSIFSTHSSGNLSNKYSFISTFDCVEALAKEGFLPVKAQESRCLNIENKPFVKHLLRFRNKQYFDKSLVVGDVIPEIVLVNSHNGSTSYQIKAGLYRLVCSNGLVVGNDFAQRSIRHQGDIVSKVLEATGEIIEVFPEVIETSREWQTNYLSPEKKREFAQKALSIKWNEGEAPILPERLLNPYRTQDMRNDLWTVYNVIQERLIRGGMTYSRRNESGRISINSTRAVKSVSENIRINTELWNLAQSMSLAA